MNPPELAFAFRQLAQGTDLLVLANIWDAGTARLAEARGARAVATTSAGLAWANGVADGAHIPVEVHQGALRRICRSVICPVTADIENGYSDNAADAAEIVMKLIEPGVQGINIEDGDQAPELLCRKIEAIKNQAARQGTDLFVNARTDVYLRCLSSDPCAETLRRASLYRTAGADGLFVPGLIEPAEIERIAMAQPLPLNLMALPRMLPLVQLRALGVRRLSAGPALLQRLWSDLTELIDGFHLQGGSDRLFSNAASYETVQTFFLP